MPQQNPPRPQHSRVFGVVEDVPAPVKKDLEEAYTTRHSNPYAQSLLHTQNALLVTEAALKSARWRNDRHVELIDALKSKLKEYGIS